MGSRHRAASGRHAEQAEPTPAPGPVSRPTAVPPLPPLASLRVVRDTEEPVTGPRPAATGPVTGRRPATTGSHRAPEAPRTTGARRAAGQGPVTGSRRGPAQGPATGSRRPAGRGPATGTRRAPGRNLRWVPVAVAIWVASFLAVPAAVLVHDAVAPDVTAVQNAADELGDDTRPAGDGTAAVVDGVSVEADAGVQDTDPQDPAPGDDPSVPADATGGAADQSTTQSEAPAPGPVVPDQTGPVAVPVVTVPAVPVAAAPSAASAAGRGTPAPVTTTPAPTTTTEPAPRPEPTEPELGAALAPTTGP